MEKDSDSAVTPVAEVVCVPALLTSPGSPQAKQLRHLHAHQLSLGQSCHRQKKPCAYACRVASVVSNSLRSCRLCLPGFSVREVLQARILERTGQYWFPYPSKPLFPAALAANPLPPQPPHRPGVPGAARTPVRSSCTTSTPGPHGGKPKSSRAASGENPSG